MAQLGGTFVAADVPEDDRNFEPMPEGDYDIQIIESEIVGTSKGGEMLKLTMEVISGPFENRKVWDNLNIVNSNPTAQGIAHRALADICSAVGVGAVNDTEELHFKPLVARIKIEPARTVGDRTYDARNGVKFYKPRAGQPPAGKAAPQARPAATPAQTAAARPARPWGNGAAARPAMSEPPF